MEQLSADQKKEILKSNNLEKPIQQAKNINSKLRVLTEYQTKEELNDEEGWREVKMYFATIFGEEKATRVLEFVQAPLKSVDLTKSILADLYRVFTPKDGYWKVRTTSDRNGEDIQKFAVYTKQKLEKLYKKVLKDTPSLAVVLDFKEDGEPHIIPIGPDRLLGGALKPDGQYKYIVFKHSEDKVAFYDAYEYSVFNVVGGEYVYNQEESNTHDIGYCPAHQVTWNVLNSKDNYRRETPLTSALAKIYEWLFFDIYKYISDHYGAMPITERIVDKCSNPKCEDGFETVARTDDSDTEQELRIPCQVCSNKTLIGPLADIMHEKSDDPREDSMGKFAFINMPIDVLNYQSEQQEQREYYIKLKTVGINNLKNQAVNELQVQGSFETQRQVLRNIAVDLEKTYKWIVETYIRAINGPEAETNIDVSWGTEWYIQSASEVLEEIKSAKEIGLPGGEVEELYRNYIDSKYQGNESVKERLDILTMLEPLPYNTLDEAIEYARNGLLSRDELFKKARFSELITRFEKENEDVTVFGSELEGYKNIEIINQKLDEYVREQRTTDGGYNGSESRSEEANDSES